MWVHLNQFDHLTAAAGTPLAAPLAGRTAPPLGVLADWRRLGLRGRPCGVDATSGSLPPRHSPWLDLARWILPGLLVAGCTSGAESSQSGSAKPAIEQTDPLHEEAARLPPPTVGLPPDPMHAATREKETFAVPPPPLSEDLFPCSDCHDDQETNPKRRVLTEEHTNIVLEHDAEHRWCLDCHNADNRDVLHLASGATVTFAESYRLCGQCHGPKLRDWRAGIHGKRTGMWNGKKQYLLCAHCHNPHSPRFKKLKPEAPPARPEDER